MNTHHVAVPENSHDLPHQTKVVPFGIYGGGLLTGHPIGLVIVIGLLFMGFVGLPEARWFFALAVPAGAICGFLMWVSHRNGLASQATNFPAKSPRGKNLPKCTCPVTPAGSNGRCNTIQCVALTLLPREKQTSWRYSVKT